MSTIKPPSAPPLFHSDEVGAPLGRDRAIREKVRLYPRASVKEIVAMFELEGLRVAPADVQKAKRQATP
ncbi:MAG TPA: hypothetical protein VNH11_27045 [Pirellulales bacterium]|nr:hypothetical protein [Pirellulales bacterium]